MNKLNGGSDDGHGLIRLVQAAAIAGRSYRAMLDAVLRGEVRGQQDDAGRWWVNEGDAKRLAAERLGGRRGLAPASA